MKIKDPVYGEFEINEPVLIKLINSPSIQRLKRIEQFGLPKKLYLFPGFSRFEHSVGVMLLLRKLNANLDEQIAGLLHDVSHTAFSHLVDWVWGDPEKEDYQDKILKKYILRSEIPRILRSHNLDLEKIISIKKFKLLERKSPEACADRVDYALREFHYWLDKSIVRDCIENLAVYDNRMVFKNKSSAKLFGVNFLKLQNLHWGGKDTITRYFLFSRILKIAMKKKILKRKDFYVDDLHILNILKDSSDKDIDRIFKLLSKSLSLGFNPKKPFIFMRKKFRYVDPFFLQNEKILKLSKNDTGFKELLEVEKKINQAGIQINLPI